VSLDLVSFTAQRPPGYYHYPASSVAKCGGICQAKAASLPLTQWKRIIQAILGQVNSQPRSAPMP